ncbi:MAG TPA: hypothetical protein VN282_11745 [Pyrinomonadaceae bacterium]|nr:hypothetical protein [Pyrinomonadaceae bacterium]
MTKHAAARILIILGALVSLCVSDNVGPRLLPLPPVSELASVPGAFDQRLAASGAPAQDKTEGARVEMITAPQSRAGAHRQSSLAAALAPKFALAVPTDPRPSRWEVHPPSAESSAPFSRPKGRAPPRLV